MSSNEEKSESWFANDLCIRCSSEGHFPTGYCGNCLRKALAELKEIQGHCESSHVSMEFKTRT